MSKNLLVDNVPDLLKEWDFKKNKKNPKNLKLYSHKKYWWVCIKDKNHRWVATLSNKVNTFKKTNSLKSNGCPWCAKKYISKDHNLKKYLIDNNKINLINFFSKKNKLKITQIMPSTLTKYWWDCRLCNKPFKVRPRDFFRDDRRRINYCPKCKYINRGKNYSLGQIRRHGSIIDINPKIKEIWDYKKNKKKPNEYSRFSHDKVWFKCIYGHSFYANIYNKVDSIGCPKCYSKGSKSEIRIYSELYKLFKEKIIWHKKFGKIEIDVFIKNLSLGIEVDGYPWHLNKEKKDLEKNKLCEKIGVKIIRVRDPKLKKINSPSVISNLTDYKFSDFKKLLIKINTIKKSKKISNYLKTAKDFKNKSLYKSFLINLPKPFKGTSLGDKYKFISKEFDLKKNFPLTPFHFTAHSNSSVWWKCKNGHSYKTNIGYRTRKEKIEYRNGEIFKRRKGTGCPYCGGRYADNKINLKKKYPELMSFYDHNKNKIKPEKLRPHSEKIIYWKCKNNHQWKCSVKKMAYRKYKCLKCNN